MTVVDCSATGRDVSNLRCDVVVIGSGCGGATAARVLAEAGRDVVVLEEGGDFVGPQRLTQRDLEMYDQLYADRGARQTADRSIAVLSGRVLGGGGVINACDVVPVHEATWRLWQQRHGLTELSPQAMAPFAALALQDLSASRIPDQMVNRNNRILQEGARALGWRSEVMSHNRVGCQGLGTCLVGCPLGSKRNPRMVAIPKAMAAGARVLTRARAVRIDGGSAAWKTVHVRALDPRGHHEDRAFSVRAQTVIVAANPVGTVALLQASGLGNRHLGRGLSLQPQVPIVAEMPEVVGAWEGIPQSVAVVEHERLDDRQALSGFRIEAIFGTPGILGSLVSQPGIEGKRLMTALPRSAASLLLLPDEPVGRVTRTWTGRARIDYTLTDEWKSRARQAVRAAAQLYFAMGARQVLVPSRPPLVLTSPKDLAKVDAWALAQASVPMISAHQQGGACLAPSEDRGAADPHGQVWGTRGVYVMDGSVFPTTSSSHTMAPILTMAHYLAGRLASL